MTAGPFLKLINWQAWAPQLPQREQWLAWFGDGTLQPEVVPRPACADVPGRLRRRCTANARAICDTALRACREAGIEPCQPRLFFGTANGEIHALKLLLEDLCQDQVLSPTAFTNSVHNVPNGYLSIAAKHLGTQRTISAFGDTFACTYLDMVASVQRNPAKYSLVMVADDRLPQPFDQMLEAAAFPYGAALLFEVFSEWTEGCLSFSATTGQVPEPLETEPVFAFLKWYESGNANFLMPTSFGGVSWRKP